ncbi:MAG: hypothetical protein GY716_04635 [bacterium]|nr:hypothetical protein [bacterium]
MISPLDLHGGGGPLTSLMIGSNEVIPDGSGYFTHQVELLSADTLITVAAYNVLGGEGSDSVEIDEEQVTHQDHVSLTPAYQRLGFGSAGVAQWLLDKQVRLRLKSRLDETIVDEIDLELSIETGEILSEPFVVSEQHQVCLDGAEQLTLCSQQIQGISLLDKVLLTPADSDDALFHDLWLVVEDAEVCRVEFAGMRITSPAPYDFIEALLDEETLELPVTLELLGRNVGPGQFGSNTPELGDPVDFSGALSSFPDPDGPSPQIVAGLPLTMGPNTISILGADLGGRPFGNCVNHSFLLNSDFPRYDPPSTGDDVEINGKKYLHFRIKEDIAAAAVAAEARRLKLKIQGVHFDGVDTCGTKQIRAIAVEPETRDIDEALQAIEASPIHEDYAEGEGVELNIVPELAVTATWPPATGRRAWHRQRDYAAARRDAKKQMRNLRAGHIGQIMGPSGDSNSFLVVDMRVETTNFNPDGLFGIKGAKSATEPLFEVQDDPPTYQQPGPDHYAVFEYGYVGHDQKARGPLNPAIGLGSGRAPRVELSRALRGNGAAGLANIIDEDTKGVILFIHGFRNDTDQPDELEADDELDMPRTVWPFVQHLYRTHGVAASDYPILHVLWTGDTDPKVLLPAGAWFNWDAALARHAGSEVLSRVIADLVGIKETMENDPNNAIDDPNWTGIAIHANSLGARVAVSALDALKTTFPISTANGGAANEVTYPRVRLVLGHPALRRHNLTATDPSVTDIPAMNCTTLQNCVPDTNVQLELTGINEHQVPGTNPPLSESALFFYSPFDKAGLAFDIAQGMTMLGRCGTPVDYVPAPVRVHSVYANSQTPRFADLWHVVLFGWHVPGSYFPSRPTYTHNGGSWRDMRRGTANSSSRMMQVTAGHIDPIWNAIGNYVKTGTLPTCEAQLDPASGQAGSEIAVTGLIRRLGGTGTVDFNWSIRGSAFFAATPSSGTVSLTAGEVTPLNLSVDIDLLAVTGTMTLNVTGDQGTCSSETTITVTPNGPSSE